jgi:hypothetical protein
LAAAIIGLATSTAAQAVGTEIVDSEGTVVGLVNGDSKALRKLSDGQWVAFSVGVGGLVVGLSLQDYTLGATVYYTSGNCTGTSYLAAGFLLAQGFVVNPQVTIGVATSRRLYYPSKPFQEFFPSSSFSQAQCTSAAEMNGGPIVYLARPSEIRKP